MWFGGHKYKPTDRKIPQQRDKLANMPNKRQAGKQARKQSGPPPTD